MGINIAPLSARTYTVGAAQDPFKKHWWAILAGFVATGLWLCFPMMETPVGSVHVDAAPKPAIDVEKSLDSADNPNGAPGGALDLSMGGGAKGQEKTGDDMASMLYQGSSGDGAAASGKPVDAKAASSASLAQQLKDAGKKTDAAGWSEKAQRGFAAPHLTGGLSGAGSAAGGSSASAGSSSFGAFGTRRAAVGYASTRGLGGDGAAADSPGLQALKASAGAASAANLKGSNEDAHAGMSQAFDGSAGKAPAKIGEGAMAQANAALDLAPANLKANDPKIDDKKLPDPPAAPAASPDASSGQSMGQQLATMAISMAVGGLVGGTAGQMIATTMMQNMQKQSTSANAASSASMQQTQAKLQ